MSFYGEKILPRVIDRVCGAAATHANRRRVCRGLHGRVVELGFGSGHNVAFYPDAVTHVAAVEPADLAWELASERVDRSNVRITRIGLAGESLPLDDDSCDSALSTWTMCTIADLPAALGEVRRVLKPGATLHFLEHGLAPDEPVRRWQHRLEPIQKRLAGGCHLTRPIVDAVREAGFEVVDIDEFYESEHLKAFSADSLGVAVSPGRS